MLYLFLETWVYVLDRWVYVELCLHFLYLYETQRHTDMSICWAIFVSQLDRPALTDYHVHQLNIRFNQVHRVIWETLSTTETNIVIKNCIFWRWVIFASYSILKIIWSPGTIIHFCPLFFWERSALFFVKTISKL